MEKLGINPTLLGFQLLNFLAILLLLNFLVFKPISKILEARRKKIEDVLAKEDEAEQKMSEVEVKKQEMLAETKKEIEVMMSEAAKKANVVKEEILEEARKESKVMMEKSKERFEAEKVQMMDEARGQIANLAVAAVENIFENRGAKEIKQKLNKEAIDKLWQKQKK